MPDVQESVEAAEDSEAASVKWWEENWVGMPEYVHEDMMPWQTIKVHFSCREDRDAFERIIGQELTDATRAVWHPAAEFADNSAWRYSPGERA